MTNIVNSTLPTPNNHSEKNKPDGVFVIKQGKTNYKVKVFFDHSSGLTAEDRLKRIIQAEAERICVSNIKISTHPLDKSFQM